MAFHVVCLGWVFFASGSLREAGDILARLATGSGSGQTVATPLLVLTVAAVIGLQYVPQACSGAARRPFAALRPVPQGAVLAFFLLVIGLLSPAGVAPFIYYRF